MKEISIKTWYEIDVEGEASETYFQIPGRRHITLNNLKYFYHCLNSEEVIYNGSEPIFEEYGPYIYDEIHTVNNVQ